MLTLSMRSFIAQVDNLEFAATDYPYVYAERSIIKLFLYTLIKGITGFKTLHRHLCECPAVVNLTGLSEIPCRTTLSRRFKALPEALHALLRQLHERFVEQAQCDSTVMGVDSTLMHANGNLWHSKDMKKGKLPTCGNIDTEAHWGVSGEGEWSSAT